MEKTKAIFNQTPEHQRAPMLYLFWIYNSVLREDLSIKDWQSFVQKHEKYFSELRIENITVRAMYGYEIPWTLYDCIKEYKKYSKNRHKNGHLSLTPLTESTMLCAIANKAQFDGFGNEYNWLINTAIFELTGKKSLQSYLYNKMLSFEQIPITELINWNKKEKAKNTA